MKPIVVRKKPGLWLMHLGLAGLALVLPLLLAIWYDQPIGVLHLCFLPVRLGTYGAAWYYASWRIEFAADGITKAVLLWKGRTYGYPEIQDVICRWSPAEGGRTVRIVFRDGRSAKFRLDDENGEKARKCLLSRCSIRNLN